MAITDMDRIKSSWAEQMEDELEETQQPQQVVINGNMKTITEFSNIDGKNVKIVRQYKIEKRKVPKCIARRKTWAKFGLSARDPPGPNVATTIISHEDVNMIFLNAGEEETNENKDSMLFGKNMANQVVQCRNCGLNHWTMNCPYKNQLSALNKINENADASKVDDRKKPGFGSLLRDGKRPELGSRGKDENNTIRITNLPEETQDSDIRDLFVKFGRITRIFLAKDKITGNSKGFAFVSFETREAAATAIKGVNGHGYMNLILSVEWARPSGS